MSNIFGNQKKGLDYKIRKGAYAVIFNPENEKVLTVQTQSGHYFLPGDVRKWKNAHTFYSAWHRD